MLFLQMTGVSNYFEREVKRRAFVVQRWDFREAEKREIEAETKRKAGVSRILVLLTSGNKIRLARTQYLFWGYGNLMVECQTWKTYFCHLVSRLMRKPTICIGENKDADQLRGNREADQRLCFRYWDSTIRLLLKSKISSFQHFFVAVQASFCRTRSETTLLVFP